MGLTDQQVANYLDDSGPQSELWRLERAVIEAAKAELIAYEAPPRREWIAESASARFKLRKATRSLIEFEQGQK